MNMVIKMAGALPTMAVQIQFSLAGTKMVRQMATSWNLVVMSTLLRMCAKLLGGTPLASASRLCRWRANCTQYVILTSYFQRDI